MGNRCELVLYLIFTIVKFVDNFLGIIEDAGHEVATKNIKKQTKKNTKCE